MFKHNILNKSNELPSKKITPKYDSKVCEIIKAVEGGWESNGVISLDLTPLSSEKVVI